MSGVRTLNPSFYRLYRRWSGWSRCAGHERHWRNLAEWVPSGTPNPPPIAEGQQLNLSYLQRTRRSARADADDLGETVMARSLPAALRSKLERLGLGGVLPLRLLDAVQRVVAESVSVQQPRLPARGQRGVDGRFDPGDLSIHRLRRVHSESACDVDR